MNEPTFFTLGQAAKVTGKSKATLSNAVKTGRLSVYEKTEHGYRIAASELFRAFPPEPPDRSLNGSDEQTITTENSSLNRPLDRELELVREERERERRQLQGTIDDLRRRLDQEAEERRRLSHVLTDERPVPRRRARWPVVLGAAVLLVLLAGAGAWLYVDPWFPSR